MMSGGLTVRDQLSNVTDFRIFPNIIKTALFCVLPNIIETAFFANFTVLFCISTCVLTPRGLRSRPNCILLALALVMYTASATVWAINLKLMWNELKIFLPELLSSIVSLDALDEMNRNLLFTENAISLVNLLLSDAVVLWRACVVWNWRRLSSPWLY
ncbi:hypothetical protein OF83DRAFT_1158899 [Amylostereum chailletii]|nr:hypothetical protein OF83DRAFT_1158899 [Amylostereum chailletii]